MTGQTHQDRIKALLTKDIVIGLTPADLGNDTQLLEELGLDSIQILGLITSLEDEFGIVLEDGDLDLANFATVDTLATFVQEKTASSQ